MPLKLAGPLLDGPACAWLPLQPPPVVQHFIEDVERNGRYTGFPALGIEWQRVSECCAMNNGNVLCSAQWQRVSACCALGIEWQRVSEC